MSDRSDIPDKLTYTCNCGWIDKNHMRDPATREFVGATNLWKQFSDYELAYWENPRVPVITDPNFKPGPGFPYPYSTQVAESDYYRLPDGRKGFKVTYIQDMGNKYFTTGVTGNYLVADGLSTAQHKAIALAIFMEISTNFEEYQNNLFWSQFTNSGFSREDLISDLIGFYAVVEGYTEKQVMSLCKEVSTEASLAIWDREGAVGDENNKNREFKPIFSECPECTTKPEFPPQFRSIKPATKGADFIDFPLTRPAQTQQYWPTPR